MKRIAVITALVGLGLIGSIGTAAAHPGHGAFKIYPNGLGGATTAECIGPVFGGTPNVSPWNGHFNSGGVVIHDTVCDV